MTLLMMLWIDLSCSLMGHSFHGSVLQRRQDLTVYSTFTLDGCTMFFPPPLSAHDTSAKS